MIRLTWTGLGIVVLVVYLCSCFGGIVAGRHFSQTLTAGILGGTFGMLAGGLVVLLLGIGLNRRRDPSGRPAWVDRHTFWNVPVQSHAAYFVILAMFIAPCATADHLPKWLTIVLWFVCAAVTTVVASTVLSFTRPAGNAPRESGSASSDGLPPPQ